MTMGRASARETAPPPRYRSSAAWTEARTRAKRKATMGFMGVRSRSSLSSDGRCPLRGYRGGHGGLGRLLGAAIERGQHQHLLELGHVDGGFHVGALIQTLPAALETADLPDRQ